jgi:hypothetical protein
LSKTNKTTTAKEVLQHIRLLTNRFCRIYPNHKYLYINPVAIKNKELREYIIGKDDFEYAYTLIEQMILPLRRTKFNKAIQSKETLSWEETLCNARRRKPVENSPHI